MKTGEAGSGEPQQAAALHYLLEAERCAGGSCTGAREVRRVGVVGAGTMGVGIALGCAQAGLDVVLADASEDALRGASQRIASTLESAVRKGRLTGQSAAEVHTRVRSTRALEALRDADLIIEAVFENATVKQRLFAQLGPLAKPGAVLATNTSTLDVEAIGRPSGRPGDVVGMHFFSPAHVMRLVEIVRTPTCSADAVATALGVARRLGKIGVVVGNAFGFVGNRMLYAYGRERELMLLEGAAPERIDRALEAFGMAMGPNAVSDLAGLDIGVAARRQWRDRPDDPRFFRVSELLVEHGRLGRKSGRGFYRYEGPERRRESDPEVRELIRAEAGRLGIAQRDVSDEEIVERCMLALIDEGARALEEGVASSAADIDVIWCNGYGFPRARGGPMFHADALGLARVLEGIERYAREQGDRYWTAAPLLRRLAREGGRLAEERAERLREVEIPSDAQHVSALINGFWAAQVLNVAATLLIPDQLAQGPKSVEELAASANAHAASLFRLMRALQTLGICCAAEGGRFGLTSAGEYLRAGVPGSLRGRALFTGDMLWRQFGDLTHVVRTGERTRAVASGSEGFEALAAEPARLHAFQTAMAEGSVRAARDALRVCDFGRFRTVLDLGGGYGGVLSVLLRSHPDMTGAVCDLPYLAQDATRYLERAGVGDRARFVAGDFFRSVPPGYDAYVMKFIIHDWDDEHAARILRHCRAAAAPTSRVVLLEQVVPDMLGTSAADQAVIRADLTMMTMGGKERTAEEYRALLREAGWTLTAVARASAEFSVLEAEPA